MQNPENKNRSSHSVPGVLEINVKLPSNDDLEDCMLADMMKSQEALAKILDECTAEDFYSTNKAAIFTAMMVLYQEFGKVEYFRLVAYLKETEQIDQVGGAAFIASLVKKAVGHKDYVDHIALFKRMSELRKVSGVFMRGIQEAVVQERNPREIISWSTEELLQIVNVRNQGWKSAAESIIENIEAKQVALSNNRMIGLPTGFSDLDKILGGIQSKYYIIGGRPSQGKSTLGKNIARNIVTKTGRPIGFFSLESSETDLSNRDIADIANVDLTVWSTLNGLHYEKFAGAVRKIKDHTGTMSKVFHDTTTGLTPGKLFSKARQLMIRFPDLACFFIDYVQKMSTGKKARGFDGENRNAELTYISNKIQDFVKILNVPFVVFSQLSRVGVDEPELHHLRDSGSLEQDCDVAILLHREGFYNQAAVQNECLAIIAKNKEGRIGRIRLGWDGSHARFFNLAPSSMEEKSPLSSKNGTNGATHYDPLSGYQSEPQFVSGDLF